MDSSRRQPRAQLIVLRSLADQYGPEALKVSVHLLGGARQPEQQVARKNAMLDLGATSIHFDSQGDSSGNIRLLAEDGKTLEEWHGFQNAAVLGGAVRAQLGAPRYAGMPLDRNGGAQTLMNEDQGQLENDFLCTGFVRLSLRAAFATRAQNEPPAPALKGAHLGLQQLVFLRRII